MNSEENRLRSFTSWPTNAPVTPANLARNGFFATGNFLEAECNWCQRRIADWRQYGEQVLDRHCALEPHCAFIVNNMWCGNIPMAASAPVAPSPSQNLSQQPDLMVEENRLATFRNWPNPNVSPQALAKAGFFYLNREDQVKCAWCKGVIAKWEKEDNAFEEHKRFFPDCPRVQLGPLIEIASDGIRDLGIQQIGPPKKPKFSMLEARHRTYGNWPISDIQRPEALAEAGLYYQDVDDHVRCFHCNIGLRSWQKEDDPWFEHAKWYPQCQFVRLVKGNNYVQQVQESTGHSTPPSVCPVMTIDEAMSTAPVRLALEIGIDGGSIRNITQRQLTTTGRPYETVENLLRAVFDDLNDTETNSSHSEDSGSGSGSGGSIVGTVSRIIQSILSAADEATEEEAPPPYSVVGGGQNQTTTTPAASAPAPPSTAASAIGKEVAVDSLKSDTMPPPAAPSARELLSKHSLSLEEENRKLKDARLCKVCLDEEVGVVFLPCGHLVTCVQCAPGVNLCPMCRTAIKGFVRTFLS